MDEILPYFTLLESWIATFPYDSLISSAFNKYWCHSMMEINK